VGKSSARGSAYTKSLRKESRSNVSMKSLTDLVRTFGKGDQLKSEFWIQACHILRGACFRVRTLRSVELTECLGVIQDLIESRQEDAKFMKTASSNLDFSVLLRLGGFKALNTVAAGSCVKIALLLARAVEKVNITYKGVVVCLLMDAWKVYAEKKDSSPAQLTDFEQLGILMAQAGQAKQLFSHGCLACIFTRPLRTASAAELLLALIPYACARHETFTLYVGYLAMALKSPPSNILIVESLLMVAAKAALTNEVIATMLSKEGVIAVVEQIIQESKLNKEAAIRRKAALLWTSLVKSDGSHYPQAVLNKRSPSVHINMPQPESTQCPLISPLDCAKSLNKRLNLWSKRFCKRRTEVYPNRGRDSSTFLIFDANFEMGNLAYAGRIDIGSDASQDYELLVGADVGSPQHVQWFYFRITNTKKSDIPVNLHIVNFNKVCSQFEEGMQPCFFSRKRYEDTKVGWTRNGQNIAYHPNEYCFDKMRYTLSFSHQFEYDNDEVYFAYFYPYGYTDMLNDLALWRAHAEVTCELLTKTPGGRDINILRFGDEWKPLIVLTARAHPGEVPGSHVMRGALGALLGNSVESLLLRRSACWWVVPMLNPDGVAVGNSRTNLAGKDLNRCHNKSDRPIELVALWERLKARKPKVFIDFHAHSKRRGCFTMGNEWREEGGHRTGQFPARLKHLASDLFDFENSEWYTVGGVGHKDEGVCRVAAGLLGVEEAFTLEASFSSLHGNDMHICVGNLVQLGRFAAKAAAQVIS